MVFAFAATNLVWLVFPLGVGLICNRQAASKGRNPWVWGVVGFFAPLIGLIAVLVLRPIEDV